MEWLQNEKLLSDIIAKINDARTKSHVERCDRYFEAINSLYSAYYQYRKRNNKLTNEEERQRKRPGDKRSFEELIKQGIDQEAQIRWLKSKEVRSLVGFSPAIMSDEELNAQKYDPNNIDPLTRTIASAKHNDLKAFYDEFLKGRSFFAPLAALCDLIYMVRCNLKHCGKTPKGPDRDKAKRDNDVCSTVVPVLDFLFQIIFENPDERLAVYGTLKRGECNHEVVANISGSWSKGHVTGELSTYNNYPTFIWNLHSAMIEVDVLKAKDLAKYFYDIDKFEGTDYRRIWIPVTWNGQWFIGNIYEFQLE